MSVEVALSCAQIYNIIYIKKSVLKISFIFNKLVNIMFILIKLILF